ncbi:hypothetical protein DPEC_G00010760 [Dallia pectoralis]|uniref:Uncharacterized protein n=1 Tax=Dallia pectoralis TaxID=75939 RepID=A0ACC2HM98_DALPE|nr:hypothetical protein DPEC_G00010760 [Dallia pectoralis]
MSNLLLACTCLLVASVPLLAHPITDSAEMSYMGPLSVVDGGANRPDGPGLIYAEFSRQGLLPSQMKRDAFLEKQSLDNPLSRFYGIRKQYMKREGTSECFWKYCV